MQINSDIKKLEKIIMQSLKSIMAWYILNGDVDINGYFIDNFKRQSKLWYFKATIGNKTISFNYRKYGDRIVLHNGAHVQIDVFTDDCREIKCQTIKELREAIQ